MNNQCKNPLLSEESGEKFLRRRILSLFSKSQHIKAVNCLTITSKNSKYRTKNICILLFFLLLLLLLMK